MRGLIPTERVHTSQKSVKLGHDTGHSHPMTHNARTGLQNALRHQFRLRLSTLQLVRDLDTRDLVLQMSGSAGNGG